MHIRSRSPALQQSELGGIFLGCGALYIGGHRRGITCTTESMSVARRIALLASERFSIGADMESTRLSGRKNALYLVKLTGPDAEEMLLETAFLIRDGDSISLSAGIPQFESGSGEEKAFLRGMFLGCGSCTNPHSEYHLELVTRTGQMASEIIHILEISGIPAKHHVRKGKSVVYLKGDAVTAFLALIGAASAAMELENVRVEKDLRNYVNRKSNCETANIGKTIEAGLLQIRAIEMIETTVGLDCLPAPLYEAARLRLSHPDATLQELADYAEIGKSGMNHRLTRLLRLAEEVNHE